MYRRTPICESGKNNLASVRDVSDRNNNMKTMTAEQEEKQGKLILFVSLKEPLERQCGKQRKTESVERILI